MSLSRPSDDQLIQLGLLVESAGRVLLGVGRIMRWGSGAVDMASGLSNTETLLHELEELKIAIGRVERLFLGPWKVVTFPEEQPSKVEAVSGG